MAKSAPAHSSFIEAPEMIPCSVLHWFRDQNSAPDEHMFDWSSALQQAAIPLANY